MYLFTRNFDDIPHIRDEYDIYAISTTKPQRYRDLSILWLFVPTFEIQIEFNMTKDINRFNERITAILKQRGSAIEDWVKANAEAKICLVCWEGVDSCHRRLIAETIRQAEEKSGIPVKLNIG